MPTQSPPPEDGVHVPLTGPEFDVVAALMRLEVADAGIRSRLRERLALNPTDLATVQYLARADAAGQDVHAKDLVAVLGVGQPAVTGIVNRLTASGHVHRDPEHEGRRSRRITLTDDTKELLADIVGDTQTLLRDVLHTMSSREKKKAVILLDQLARALDDGVRQRPGL